MNDKELALEIDKWFKYRLNDPNKWHENATGRTIKDNLKKLGNWKNKARGNPSKGAEMKKRKLLA